MRGDPSADGSRRPELSRFDARAAIGAILQRWPLMLVVVVVVVGATLALALTSTKRYSATASVYFRLTDFSQQISGQPINLSSQDPIRQAATNTQLLSLRQVAATAARKLGISTAAVQSAVSVASEGQSDVVDVTATEPSPTQAATVANTYVEQFIALRKHQDQGIVAQAQQLLASQLAGLRRSSTNAAQIADLTARAEQLKVISAVQTGNVELVQPATAPSGPSSPRPRRDGVLGLLLGIVLAVFIAALANRLDRRVRGEDEIQGVFQLPVLAEIPIEPELKADEGAMLGASHAEPFRLLRTSLRYTPRGKRLRTIVITSPAAGDGKSTVAWNLAIAAARAGDKVLLLEADLRRPTMAQRAGQQPRFGLIHIILGTADQQEATVKLPVGVGNVEGEQRALDVIFAGGVPDQPDELLESRRMRELLTVDVMEYDLVVVDTPPVGLVADAIPLLTEVDGVIAVVRVRHTDRKRAEALRNRLASIGAPVLGLVVNALEREGRGSYVYGYGHDESREGTEVGATSNGSPGAGSRESLHQPRETKAPGSPDERETPEMPEEVAGERASTTVRSKPKSS